MAEPVAGNPPLVEGQTRLLVWLERETAPSGETVLKPYLKSLQPLHLSVRVSLTQNGQGGTSTLHQQAHFQVASGESLQLGLVKLSLPSKEKCHLILVLQEAKTTKPLGTHRFDCQP